MPHKTRANGKNNKDGQRFGHWVQVRLDPTLSWPQLKRSNRQRRRRCSARLFAAFLQYYNSMGSPPTPSPSPSPSTFSSTVDWMEQSKAELWFQCRLRRGQCHMLVKINKQSQRPWLVQRLQKVLHFTRIAKKRLYFLRDICWARLNRRATPVQPQNKSYPSPQLTPESDISKYINNM